MNVVIIEGGLVQAVYGKEPVVIVDRDTEGWDDDEQKLFDDALVTKHEPDGDVAKLLSDIFYEEPELMKEVSHLTGVQSWN